MKLERILDPAVEPVTLAQAKAHLRLDDARDDGYLASLIVAARELCEGLLDRALIQQTWKLTLDAWPAQGSAPWWDGTREGAIADVTGTARHIDMPKGLLSVTSIQTLDEAGVATTFGAANYFTSAGKMGRIILAAGAAWPLPGRGAAGIEITFLAGFGATPEIVPQSIRTGLLMLVAHLYENRGDEPAAAARATGVTALWRPHARVAI